MSQHEGFPIDPVAFYCFRVRAMVQAPVHVSFQPRLDLLWRRHLGLAFLEEPCRAAHDAEEVRVFQSDKVAQEFHVRREVDNPRELVFCKFFPR